MTETPRPTREADDTAAPLLFVYIAGVVAYIVAFLAWVFWYRGYA
jgi:hypothetical protein